MEYEFHVGDYVETSGGHEGYILKYDCFSDEFPAVWFFKVYHKEYGHSTVYEVRENCFPAFFNRIGQYDFTKKDEGKIKPLVKSWILEGTISNGEYYFDSREVIKKINELVEAVNWLEEEVNGVAQN